MAQNLRSQQYGEIEKTEVPSSQGIVHSATGAAKGTTHTVLKTGEAVVKQVVGAEEPGKTYHDLGKGTIQKTADLATSGIETVVEGALDVGATVLGVVEGTATSVVGGATSVVGGATHVASKGVQRVHETVHPPVARTADSIAAVSSRSIGGVQSAAQTVSKTVHPPVARTADTVVDTTAALAGLTVSGAKAVAGGAQSAAHTVNRSVHAPVAKTADTVVDTTAALAGLTVSGAKAVVGGAQSAVHAVDSTIHPPIAKTADAIVDTASGVVQGAKHTTSRTIEGTHATIHPPIAKTADFTLHTAAHASGVGYGLASEAAKTAQDVAHGANVKVHGVVASVADTTVDTANLTHRKVHDVVATVADTAVDGVTNAFGTLASVVGFAGDKSSETAIKSKDFSVGEGTVEAKGGGFGLSVPSIPFPEDVKAKHHEGRETAKHAIDSVKNLVLGTKSE